MRWRTAIVVASTVSAALAATAPAASARGGDWQYAGNPGDFGVSCPSGTLDAHTLTAREYFRTTTMADGTILVQVTGALTLRVSNPATGESTMVNASGPAAGPWRTEYRADGDYLFSATGLSFVFGVEGLPGALVTSGPIRILFTSEGAVVELMPHHALDVCELLGAG